MLTIFFLNYRSATLVLAYLMKYQKMKLIDAHAYVKARRPLIRPNSGFWKDLVDFERKLFQKNTIEMVDSKFGGYLVLISYWRKIVGVWCSLIWGTESGGGGGVVGMFVFRIVCLLCKRWVNLDPKCFFGQTISWLFSWVVLKNNKG